MPRDAAPKNADAKPTARSRESPKRLIERGILHDPLSLAIKINPIMPSSPEGKRNWLWAALSDWATSARLSPQSSREMLNRFSKRCQGYKEEAGGLQQ